MSFVRAANPIWYMVDHLGQPLNDEYYAFFLTNTLPYLPQNVYRDPQGQTVWTGNVVQFQPSGTLPNNLYFDPDLVYRIEIRHGDSRSDELIFEVNNFVPGGGSNIVNELSILTAENQVSNSQFAEINFVSPLTITTAGEYNIAPGWDIVLVGTGTTTLTQLVFAADQNTDDNPTPPYALRINNNGWTEAYLRQRFEGIGGLFNNGAISMSVTGMAQSLSEQITLVYQPEVGAGVQVAQGTLDTAGYQVIAGVANVGQSTNNVLSDESYVDMKVVLPTIGIVDLSNIQMVGQTDPVTDPSTTTPPTYQQEPNERMIDHLFHYYRDQIIEKPKRSLLVGWNFPQNPYQFIDSTLATKATQVSYIADQTILYQEAASQLQTGRNTVAERGNLLVKAVTAATTTRFALIQYIDPQSIQSYWSYILSALVRARIFTSHGTEVRLKARLIYRSSLPSTIGAAEPIASWAADSDPAFSAGWTALAPLNDPAYVLPNAYAENETEGANAYPAFSFNEFELPNADNANMTLGIVIYTMDNLDATGGTEDSIAFDRISLIPSKFASDALPQTWDETLRQCQFYYEKSYEVGVLPGTITPNGIQYQINYLLQNGGNYSLRRNALNIPFQQIKRAAPTITFYSPTNGAANTIRMEISDGIISVASSEQASTNWTQVGITRHNAAYLNNVSAEVLAGVFSLAYVMTSRFHYVSDARLGV